MTPKHICYPRPSWWHYFSVSFSFSKRDTRLLCQQWWYAFYYYYHHCLFLILFFCTEFLLQYITALIMFLLFSMAITPSFIKDLIVDYDVLCPVMIAFTGLSALICVCRFFKLSIFQLLMLLCQLYCIITAYLFLKFHRKYIKRKATLPVVYPNLIIISILI